MRIIKIVIYQVSGLSGYKFVCKNGNRNEETVPGSQTVTLGISTQVKLDSWLQHRKDSTLPELATLAELGFTRYVSKQI